MVFMIVEGTDPQKNMIAERKADERSEKGRPWGHG